METVRVCPGLSPPRSVGRSRTQIPNARALIRLPLSRGPSRRQKTFVARNSATGAVMPVNRDMKK